jgi:predicted RNase H-like HicB family nuclease
MSQIRKNNFDGFSIKIFQDEDGDWLAHFIELPNISAFADDAHAALDELELAWTGVKESYRQHGEDIPRPAKITLQRDLAHSASN